VKDIKKLIYRELIIRQNEKIKNLQLLIKSTTDSRNSNTKSSAGDKHETSRAKIQTEFNNYSKQLKSVSQENHQIKKKKKTG
jgi:predicted RNA-binding protein